MKTPARKTVKNTAAKRVRAKQAKPPTTPEDKPCQTEAMPDKVPYTPVLDINLDELEITDGSECEMEVVGLNQYIKQLQDSIRRNQDLLEELHVRRRLWVTRLEYHNSQVQKNAQRVQERVHKAIFPDSAPACGTARY